VYSRDLTETVAEALSGLGTHRAMVVHGADGIDELSPAGVNLVYHVNGSVSRQELDPADLGIPRCSPAELSGGSPTENAAAIRSVFEGAPGAKRDAVVLNAAAALYVAELVSDLREGVSLASTAIDSGAAADRLGALVSFSRMERAEAS
jgi:anthranilate phosphoribosyltransferase